ncbi:MAG: glycoside hydrolase family 65 protein [Candidatus Aureabacteria bacterium]|nr:glycoside hydrolase family 65 protein [Candidatus Auribacterota bacterium]
MHKTNKDTWKIVFNGFEPEQETLRETLCTIGNGYFATRGAAPESTASELHYPGTYMAGVYNRLATHIAGRTITNEDLVNCPNWLGITFSIGDDDWFCPSTTKILSYDQELDMKQCILTRDMRVQNWKGQITDIRTSMIVSMANPHLGLLQYSITPVNYSETITLRSIIDGSVQNTGVKRYRQLNSKHLKTLKKGSIENNGLFLLAQTNHSKIKLAIASRMQVYCDGKKFKTIFKPIIQKETVISETKFQAEKKKTYIFEKTTAIYTSKDDGIKDPLSSAITTIKRPQRFSKYLSIHIKKWEKIWEKIDIEIEGNIFSQKVLRLHMFHLMQSASSNTIGIDASVAARGLHGEAYRGHIFWDELYLMPFFDLHFPEISKSLLMYRYRRLTPARQYAKENGYNGAMFPWQGGLSGKEETQEIHLNPMSGEWGIDHSRLQRHVSLAIAYNVWEHFKRTQDKDFLIKYGAEMILSISQFFSSLVYYDAHDKRYHTRRIMGPDEFHEKLPKDSQAGLKDNAYTNLMIVWLLLRAQETLELLPESDKRRIIKKIKLSVKDLEKWSEITKKMHVCINENGIVSQFEGYFSLKELDWKKYKKKYRNIHRMDRILKAEGKSPDKYKLSKQADFLMLFYLLPLTEVKEIFKMLAYTFTTAQLKKNYDYYIKRTSHGSTLSKIVHCFLADVIGESTLAWQFYCDVLESDIYDTQGGTTKEGIHTGVMGGSIDIVLRGFAGINTLKDRIHIYPTLPKDWKSLKFKFCYRGKWISIMLTHSKVSFIIHGPKTKSFPVPIQISGKLHYCSLGKKYSFKY